MNVFLGFAMVGRGEFGLKGKKLQKKGVQGRLPELVRNSGTVKNKLENVDFQIEDKVKTGAFKSEKIHAFEDFQN